MTGEQSEQALGSYPLLLQVSHPGGPCDFEVAGSASLSPALAFQDVLAECPEGPFRSGLSGQKTTPRACFSALTEARAKPVEIAPAAAFPNWVWRHLTSLD